jgi:hypothetical protein
MVSKQDCKQKLLQFLDHDLGALFAVPSIPLKPEDHLVKVKFFLVIVIYIEMDGGNCWGRVSRCLAQNHAPMVLANYFGAYNFHVSGQKEWFGVAGTKWHQQFQFIDEII